MSTQCTVRVCYADRRDFGDDVAAGLVTQEDLQGVPESMQARRRAEYVAGRALLRHALERHTRRPARSFRICTSASGKPECADGPAISLSHSGELLVCAVAEKGAVGIDVEARRPRGELSVIAERHFTAAEARWLAADPVTRFAWLWVLKEAYLKALGVGLAGGLGTLECSIEPPAIVAHTRGGPVPQLELWAGPACHVGLAVINAARLSVEVERVGATGGRYALSPLISIAATT